MFSADARGNKENKKRRNPGAIFVPAESQKEAEISPDVVSTLTN